MSTTGIPRDLQTTLEAYKTNYSAYKVTGIAGYKTAYENALASANQVISNSMNANQSNDQFIQKFLSDYQQANPEIVNLHNESKKIREEGPKLQNELARSKQIHQRAAIEVNESALYVKAGIVVALLVVVGIVGSL